MLHPRDHLLADEAAFLEIDPMELVHVGFMREGVPIDEIEAAGGHAELDPMRLIGGGIDQLGPERGRRVGRVGRRDAAQAQFRQAGVRIARAPVRRRSAVPDRHHAGNSGQILDDDLCAQFVEAQPLDQRGRERTRAVEVERVAMGRTGIRNDEVHDDLALRGQERGKAGARGGHLAHVGGHEPVEELAGIDAGDLDHAAVGENRCLHTRYLPDVAPKRKARRILPPESRRGGTPSGEHIRREQVGGRARSPVPV